MIPFCELSEVLRFKYTESRMAVTGVGEQEAGSCFVMDKELCMMKEVYRSAA